MSKPTKQSWKPVFLDFIGHMKILSKELDSSAGMRLLDVMYHSQHRYLDQICEGLDRGVRFFVCLKGRQQGISTISLAIDVFWMFMHPGIQGALITDDEGNRDKFRAILEYYLRSLPKGLRVGVRRHNRTLLELDNGSMLDYLVAGKRSTNVTLAQSRALNFVHGTEVGSWGSEEGFNSMIASLAERHPNRLYMFESTAHGFNLFHDVWQQAKADSFRKKAFFIGWWAKDDYSFDRKSSEFAEYWDGRLDEGEAIKADIVRAQYGFEIKPEQIAWHRYKRTHDITSDDLMSQNYPWDETEAFIMSGRAFFPVRKLSHTMKVLSEEKPLFKGFRYHMTDNFLGTGIEQVDSPEHADLKIWQEPDRRGVYVIGCDPAFGRSDTNDWSAIEVLRCYADRVIQVAQFGTPEPETHQLAWVLAHLAGSYRNCWVNLEINGPGPAVMRELQHLKQMMDSGVYRADVMAAGMSDVFDDCKWFLYHRPDSPGPGFMYHWKTNAENKFVILNEMRSAYFLNQFRFSSIELCEQMMRIVQTGNNIEADGKGKDDLVFASALAIKAWTEWVRPAMMGDGETYEKVTEREIREATNPHGTMMAYIIQDFFVGVDDKRTQDKIDNAWRR